MDTETKRIVCKRKLDEKKEELKIEKETLAKKRKEKVDSVERSEKTVKWFQKVIEEKEEEVEKIKVEKNDKLLFIKNLKAQIDELEKDSNKRVSMIEEEVGFYQNVMNDLDVVLVTVESPSNPEFLTFLDDTIREKEKELECPVCLEVAEAPVYKCPNDHLLCQNCVQKLKDCPKCRRKLPKTPLKHRYAENIVDELQRLRERRNASGESMEHVLKCSNGLKAKDGFHQFKEIHFRVLETTMIGKLKEIFSERVGIDVNRLRFCFDGRRLDDNDTPKALGMEKMEEIDVFGFGILGDASEETDGSKSPNYKDEINASEDEDKANSPNIITVSQSVSQFFKQKKSSKKFK